MAQDRYWTVSRTPEVVRWLDGLPQRDARRIRASIELLHRHGLALGRPRADSIRGSRHHHMKELRSPGRYLRVLYAFDPDRTAVLLIGGDKQGQWKRWYEQTIPKAEALYDRHLRQGGREGRWRTRGPQARDRAQGREL